MIVRSSLQQSAIRAVLKDDRIRLNEDLFLVSSLMRACKYTNDSIHTRLPIQKGLLSLILNQVKEHFNLTNQPYLSILYRTLFSTMYYGLLRISEVSQGGHPMLARDVHIGSNKKKMLFILRTSKTHWYGCRPQIVKISSTASTNCIKCSNTDAQHCPFSLLR